MGKPGNINVFWWSSVEFEGKSQENFGDILSKYLVEKISGQKVIWKNPNKKNWNPFQKKIITTTGSILKHVSKSCVVWGSGIISRDDKVEPAEFLALRGPETYIHLKAMGYKPNAIFGDPAIVLPNLYVPNVEKEYEIGIIPHYVDFEKINEQYQNNNNIKVIDLLNDDIEAVIDEINQCKSIISSSLHGVIVSHTYEIPAVWVKYSDKLSGDDVKFVDYFKSVNLKPYKPNSIESKLEMKELNNVFKSFPSLPEKGIIKELSQKLMEVCPFN